jgi:DNA-binding transcriptional ArsR family regulator
MPKSTSQAAAVMGPGHSLPSSSPALPDSLLERVAARFRALGSPSRLRILSALMEGPLLMADLGQATGLEASNLSRHVLGLEQDGCVARERLGREVRVRIADPSLPALCDLVCGAVLDNARRQTIVLGSDPPTAL